MLIKITKLLPIFIAILFIISIILGSCGIDTISLACIGGISILSLAYLYISSFALEFTKNERLPIHYIAGVTLFDCICAQIYISESWFYIIHYIWIFVFIGYLVYLKLFKK